MLTYSAQFPEKTEACVRWLQKDETTFYMDEMRQKERWQYYISSYMSVEPTEGVPRTRLQKTVLARNLPSTDEKAEEGNIPKAVSFTEGLVHKVCLNSLKIIYKEGTGECFVYDQTPPDAEERDKQAAKMRAISKKREDKMREKLVLNSSWMKNMSQPDVERYKDGWVKWINEGIPPARSDGAATGTTE